MKYDSQSTFAERVRINQERLFGIGRFAQSWKWFLTEPFFESRAVIGIHPDHRNPE